MDLSLILAIHFIALLTPGPDLFLVSTYALKSNFKHAFKAVLGISAGVLVWIVLCLFGLKLFFESFSFMRTLIALLGALYLFYLAFSCLKSLNKSLEWQNSAPRGAFLSGFLTNLLNPKAALYFGSIFSSLDFASGLLWVILAISVETCLFFSAIALLFSKDSMKKAYTRYYKAIDITCAILFSAFGGLILFRVFGLK
ncbi:LysE family transporter [Helicobacter sp. L8]|uniref:LysE family transporter n=1 Tax=Helicobacter sp. L8 TaxID=2316078 RepID=UPI000EAF3B6E|nr:LysE family transporter [Helicobacter sp. L8]